MIADNVIAPANISNLFAGMANLTSADLAGLDTSNVTNASNVFANCSQLSKINIGLKTFAKNIFTGLTGKLFLSKDGVYGPYWPANCTTDITDKNIGWYDVLPGGTWGTCMWEIKNGVLTIHEGEGKNFCDNIASHNQTYVPWYSERSSIKEVVISESVVAPVDISYMFYEMTNLTKADLSGLDTSQVICTDDIFTGDTQLSQVKIGSKTFAQDIFTGIDNKAFESTDSSHKRYSSGNCAIAITNSNAGWYNVVDANLWGSCLWDIENGVLTIHEGTGANIHEGNKDLVEGNARFIPWWDSRAEIKEINISEKVIAPAQIPNMFNEMINLAKADLSGFDTSHVTAYHDVFAYCTKLSEINIGPKTFATNILTGYSKIGLTKQLVPQSGGDPILAEDLSSAINAGNTGWYSIFPGGTWGTCVWSLVNGVLTVYAGTGADTSSNTATYVPWYSYRDQIKEVVISENVVAPSNVSYMFYGMTDLTKVDLSGFDTTNVKIKNAAFTNCPALTAINIGPNTLATNILTGLNDKKLVSQANGAPLTPGNTGWYNVVDTD